MGDIEVKELKEDVKEIKRGQERIMEGFNDLRVLVAGNYVTKDELGGIEQKVDDLTKTTGNKFYNLIEKSAFLLAGIIIAKVF